MTSPAQAVGIRGKGRHYPFPPTDHSGWPRNQWGSVNPEDIPEGVTMLPSVTNVLSCVNKEALKGWAAEQAIRSLYESGIVPLDVERALEAHKYAFNRVAGERADAGTRAHTIAERMTRDLPLPESISDEDEAFADAYMAFWADHDPEVLEVEATLYGDGYAGTADLIAVIAEPTVVDYKTRGKKPDPKKRTRYGLLYDETRMQLAALAAANGVGAGMGVVLFPDGTYDLEHIDNDLDRWYGGFRGALSLWHALKDSTLTVREGTAKASSSPAEPSRASSEVGS